MSYVINITDAANPPVIVYQNQDGEWLGIGADNLDDAINLADPDGSRYMKAGEAMLLLGAAVDAPPESGGLIHLNINWRDDAPRMTASTYAGTAYETWNVTAHGTPKAGASWPIHFGSSGEAAEACVKCDGTLTLVDGDQYDVLIRFPGSPASHRWTVKAEVEVVCRARRNP